MMTPNMQGIIMSIGKARTVFEKLGPEAAFFKVHSHLISLSHLYSLLLWCCTSTASQQPSSHPVLPSISLVLSFWVSCSHQKHPTEIGLGVTWTMRFIWTKRTWINSLSFVYKDEEDDDDDLDTSYMETMVLSSAAADVYQCSNLGLLWSCNVSLAYQSPFTPCSIYVCQAIKVEYTRLLRFAQEDTAPGSDYRLQHVIVYFIQNQAPKKILERTLLMQFADRNLGFNERYSWVKPPKPVSCNSYLVNFRIMSLSYLYLVKQKRKHQFITSELNKFTSRG